MYLLSQKFTVPLQLLIMVTWTSADSALVSHALLLKMCILIFFLLIPPGLGNQLGTLKHELRKFWLREAYKETDIEKSSAWGKDKAY